MIDTKQIVSVATRDYRPQAMFNAKFLCGMPQVPTGAVVRRGEQLARVIAPLSADTLLVVANDGRTVRWPVVEDEMPTEVVAVPDIPVLSARTGWDYYPEVGLGLLLMAAPASFFVKLHDAGWRVELDLRNPSVLAQQLQNLQEMMPLKHKYVEFDQDAVIAWLKEFRRGVWAHLVCHSHGVVVEQLGPHPAVGYWVWRRNEEAPQSVDQYHARVWAELEAAEVITAPR